MIPDEQIRRALRFARPVVALQFHGAEAQNVRRCGMVKFLTRMGAPELTPLICCGDFHIQKYLPAGIEFKRTQVIAEGGECCDFRYYATDKVSQ